MHLLIPRGSALPWFAILVLAEIAWMTVVARRDYPWRHALASVGVAVGQFVANAASATVVGFVYLVVWQHRLWTVPMEGPLAWATAFVLVEFTYYWFHRWSHEVRWLWVTHATHHTSTELHLPAAIRLGWTGLFSGGWLLWTPVVLIGFHPVAVASLIAINLIYQFWLHTEMVPRLGPLEWVLNTPAHHRVHHAVNPRYLDTNYGGTVIVFDRLFGTFAAEDPAEPCRYGLTDPNRSHNPFRIALREWGRLALDLWRARGLRTRLGFAFGPPGWRPDGTGLTTARIRAEAGLREPA